MKVRLVVMGIDRGIIEVSEDSLVGSLLTGNLDKTKSKLKEMQEEINSISPAIQMTSSIRVHPSDPCPKS